MRTRWWIAGLVVAALVRSLLLATITPPYQSSDEQWHLDVARVQSEGHLPVFGTTVVAPEITAHVLRAAAERHLHVYGVLRDPMEDIEAIQPPVGYVGPSIGYRLASGPEGALFAFRVYDALAGAVVAALAFVVAAAAFPGRRWAGPLAGLAAVCSPPVAMVASTANNDATLAVFAVAAIGLAAVLARDGRTLRWWFALGALVGLSTVTKTSGFLLLPPAVLAAVIAPNADRQTRLARMTTVVLTTVAIYAPVGLRNYALYDNAVDPRVLAPGSLSELRGPFWVELGRGAVGVLRWTDLFLPLLVYLVAAAVVIAAGVCVVRWLMNEATSADHRATAVIVCAFLAFVAGVILYSFRIDYQPQGRYLVPGLIAMGGLVGAAVDRRGFVVGATALVGLLACAIGTSVAMFGGPI